MQSKIRNTREVCNEYSVSPKKRLKKNRILCINGRI